MCVFHFFNIYIFIWLQQVFAVACRFFSCDVQLLGCSMWNPVPWAGIELWPPAPRALSLSHWTTREVPYVCTLKAPSPPNTFLHASLARFGYMPFPRPVTKKVKVAQSCPTFCNPMDDTVPGILQTRILEWVAFAFSRDLPNPGIKLRSPTLQADSLLAEAQGKPSHWEKGLELPQMA